MQTLTLKVRNIQVLKQIQKNLSERLPLTERQQNFLSDFLVQLPQANTLLLEKIAIDEPLEMNLWDVGKIETKLDKWVDLLNNLPGWDYCPFSFLVNNDNPDLLKKDVVIVAWFAPSYSYNSIRSEQERAYEIWLKGDGTAIFQLPTLEDAEQYPDLYNFKGTWKEAYYLLIETLKKGWPMEEFPEELLPLLKK